MTIQRSNRTRSLLWEDEAPAEPRIAAHRAGCACGRARPPGAPGMPLEMDGPDGDDDRRSAWGGFRRRPLRRAAQALVAAGQHRRARLSGAGCARRCWAGWPPASFLLKTYLERDARFRIAGSRQHRGHGADRSQPRGDAAGLWRRHRAQHLLYSFGRAARQLEEIPWVEKATVMRLLPDQIRVSMVERQPVAFVRQGQQIGLVDANGVLLTMPAAMMAQRHYSFPVVTGIDAHDPLALAQGAHGGLSAPAGGAGRQRPASLRADIGDRSDRSGGRPRADARSRTRDILAHFGQDHFLERYQRYKAHISGVAAAVSQAGGGGFALRPAGGAGDGSRHNAAKAAGDQARAGTANGKHVSQGTKPCRKLDQSQSIQHRKHALRRNRPKVKQLDGGRSPGQRPRERRRRTRRPGRLPRESRRRIEARGGQTRRAEREQAEDRPNHPPGRVCRPGQ